MGRVHKIGISKKKGNQILEMTQVELVQGKGIVDDRYFKINNQKECQITLIEIENINNYNKKSGANIPAINFRRNIITKNIRLNELLKKEFYVGNVKLKAHDLCRPCKYLQESLSQNNIIKEFLQTGGLRCEILSSGKIFVDDIIKN